MTLFDKHRKKASLSKAKPFLTPSPRSPRSSLLISERKLLLAIVDIVLFNIALAISLYMGGVVANLDSFLAAPKWFVTATAVYLICAVIFDAYNLPRTASTTHSVQAVIYAASLGSLGTIAIPWLAPPIYSRTQIYLFFIFANVLLASGRAIYALLLFQPTFERRALVVGAGDSGKDLAQALQSSFAEGNANHDRPTNDSVIHDSGIGNPE